ncbi:MAG: hypothetical protein V4722_20400 [Bacteroidota bacterium]
MKYFRLFIISVVVFGLMIFCISLLFPSVTYVSRAMNIAGGRDSVRATMPQLFSKGFNQQQTQIAFVKDFSASGDTLHFKINGQEQVNGALAVYAMGEDSTTIQVFYQINTPWYKPWQKFGLMLNEEKYGPSLDTAISRITSPIQQ